ncbi:MAG: tRNA 2-thiouridine(34) synthase MnmA [Candidatus Marinimicrobia bacterium]|jgi:tRNA-specific 2-thiouridylase|nr:tRNA 2-thiouridine(34) synthase MnmA [Candidatus Neomarinimicrobiota bacterium]MBT3500702.1 tRNA 2-thiouridine(34) synthase MnmA [Candidatus Neomarinimicrobiota bacterium]MBT3839550.1 tRNA 2-thiouridine(34) synthase MnmA [Candidatus Neomarinimicrobiota bacterium]MBT3998920.1 tRNA 2-thiouridine(34) synthase MnmA [Candidatus Neomarinimicrobiota bacterium]MBT4282871.1 tRNA 2-thiouridine(34) synthase MnmA [Candidatus Neomarinimicrobiota bacterium]
MGHITVGMSGGVDSAVAASILVEQGYEVEGLFMKNWEDDSKYCSAEEDYKDALQVCDVLGIPLRSVNFAKEYWDRVFQNFLDEYKAGRTPNPDILCNTEIKFKEFLNYAKDLGADKIATGHYVRNQKLNGKIELLKGLDPGKDQSYFLYRLNQEQISTALFPIGNLEKSNVRARAEKLGFDIFDKKDSTGICFIGERDFKEFLQQYLPAQPGIMKTSDGTKVGEHDGLMYYTLGQRKGLGIGGGHGDGDGPWYVLDKDLTNNELIVGRGHTHAGLYQRCLTASNIHWISGEAPTSENLMGKIRYRAQDANCRITNLNDTEISVEFEDPRFAIAPGQSVVFYNGDVCLGGAIIDKAFN